MGALMYRLMKADECTLDLTGCGPATVLVRNLLPDASPDLAPSQRTLPVYILTTTGLCRSNEQDSICY